MTNYNFSSKFKYANIFSITLFLISIILLHLKDLIMELTLKGVHLLN